MRLLETSETLFGGSAQNLNFSPTDRRYIELISLAIPSQNVISFYAMKKLVRILAKMVQESDEIFKTLCDDGVLCSALFYSLFLTAVVITSSLVEFLSICTNH